MRALVTFSAGAADYALPIEQVERIEDAVELTPLPGAQAGVAGLLPDGDSPIPVLATLGGGGRRVIVLAAGGRRFGLAVETVEDIARVETGAIGPPPAGRDEPLVSGVVTVGGAHRLLLDGTVLAAGLG